MAGPSRPHLATTDVGRTSPLRMWCGTMVYDQVLPVTRAPPVMLCLFSLNIIIRSSCFTYGLHAREQSVTVLFYFGSHYLSNSFNEGIYYFRLFHISVKHAIRAVNVVGGEWSNKYVRIAQYRGRKSFCLQSPLSGGAPPTTTGWPIAKLQRSLRPS